LTAAMLGCAFFEREVFAGRIGLRGLGMIEDFAERSRKCCCEAERSVSSTLRHLATNSETFML
jgi:hypothetical protein